MPLLVMMILQIASVAAPNGGVQECPEQNDEIVVCHKAVEPDRYRLPLRGDNVPVAKNGPPRADWGLGGGVRMGVSVESAAMPQGATSKRAMVNVNIPF